MGDLEEQPARGRENETEKREKQDRRMQQEKGERVKNKKGRWQTKIEQTFRHRKTER